MPKRAKTSSSAETAPKQSIVRLFLLAQGKHVQIVSETEKELVDKEQSLWVRAFVVPHLQAQGVRMWHNVQIGSVVEGGLEITFSTGENKTLECDSVLECYDMLPNSALVR